MNRKLFFLITIIVVLFSVSPFMGCSDDPTSPPSIVNPNATASSSMLLGNGTSSGSWVVLGDMTLDKKDTSFFNPYADFSVTFWINPVIISPTNGDGKVLEVGSVVEGQGGYPTIKSALNISMSGDSIAVKFGGNSNNKNAVSTKISSGGWTHVSVVKNGLILKIIAGSSSDTISIKGETPPKDDVFRTYACVLSLGKRHSNLNIDNSSFHKFNISCLSLHEKALSSVEIGDIQTRIINPSEYGCTKIWSFNGASAVEKPTMSSTAPVVFEPKSPHK